MDKLIVFVIMALSFNAMFMAQAFAQNTTVITNSGTEDLIGSYTALIVAIGTLVGTIGSIIGVLVVFIRDKKTRDYTEAIGVGMATFGQKTVENTDRISKVVRAGYELSPEEGKKFLQDNKMEADKLTESVKKGNEQLNVIMDQVAAVLPKEKQQILTKKNELPHESFETKPTV